MQETNFWTLCTNHYVGGIKIEVAPWADPKYIKGSAEIIIGKQRNGPIGTCRLAFLGKYTRFENLAGDYFTEN